MFGDDIPSPIDLRLMPDASDWEASAATKRPWRSEFFAAFGAALVGATHPVRRVLELGSGPGFLAEVLLRELPDISYIALDFSAAMHQLAATRLGSAADRVRFVERSFRDEEWADGLGLFEAIVTNQAVHELRHKRHALPLHMRARGLLLAGGSYLVCDHFLGEGGMSNDQLYMSVVEQREALLQAGFSRADELLVKGGLVLHHAT